MLLAVLVLPLPKENELASPAVEAPKRLVPPVVVLLELGPNADCIKEKPLDDPALLAGWPKLLCPNTDLLKPAPVEALNPVEPNPVAEGAEEAGGTAGCPKTVLAVVVGAGVTVVRVAVVAAGAAVLITGVTPIELLSVVAGAGAGAGTGVAAGAGAGCVKMEPGFSEMGTWNAGGAPWEIGAMVGAAEVETEEVNEGSGVASVEKGTMDGGGGFTSAGATLAEGRSWVVAVVSAGSAGVEVAVDEESTPGSGATD